MEFAVCCHSNHAVSTKYSSNIHLFYPSIIFTCTEWTYAINIKIQFVHSELFFNFESLYNIPSVKSFPSSSIFNSPIQYFVPMPKL